MPFLATFMAKNGRPEPNGSIGRGDRTENSPRFYAGVVCGAGPNVPRLGLPHYRQLLYQV